MEVEKTIIDLAVEAAEQKAKEYLLESLLESIDFYTGDDDYEDE